MQLRESEIHFSRWLFDRKEKNWLNIILFSLAIHALFFFILYYLKPQPELVTDQSPASIKINFSNLQQEKNEHLNKKNPSKSMHQRENKPNILTDTNNNSQSKFFSSAEIPSEIEQKDKEINKEKPRINSDNNMSTFLPHSNNDYVNNLRQQNQSQNKTNEMNGGDIPIEGPSLAPSNSPRMLSRYVEKDMSLFQFSQEFRERFSAIWNAEDRVVPPTSPLRPGDVVYYRVYIKSNGKMEKFENLSHLSHPLNDYSDTDKLFSQVVNQVFPMSVPPKFAHKNIILTQDLAIQVVGRNMPAQFSF